MSLTSFFRIGLEFVQAGKALDFNYMDSLLRYVDGGSKERSEGQ